MYSLSDSWNPDSPSHLEVFQRLLRQLGNLQLESGVPHTWTSIHDLMAKMPSPNRAGLEALAHHAVLNCANYEEVRQWERGPFGWAATADLLSRRLLDYQWYEPLDPSYFADFEWMDEQEYDPHDDEDDDTRATWEAEAEYILAEHRDDVLLGPDMGYREDYDEDETNWTSAVDLSSDPQRSGDSEPNDNGPADFETEAEDSGWALDEDGIL